MVFFYYSDRGVPAGRFKKRAQWQGNISRWDGSILLQDLRVNDSGTYVCELRLRESSDVFKSRTVLLVSPAPRAAAGSEDAAPPRDSGFWPAVVGCGCVAVVVAFLAGLCVRKRYRRCLGPLCVWGLQSPPSPSQEAIYSSIPGAEVPKAEQEAKKKRAEDTYITMHPSRCRENGVYVELAKRAIPSEWMAEGTQGAVQSQELHSRSQEALPRPPEQQK
ncbi:JAML protein, partial [Spelaeornis formosus]|nr:JAML protein [Elachura formosa]